MSSKSDNSLPCYRAWMLEQRGSDLIISCTDFTPEAFEKKACPACKSKVLRAEEGAKYPYTYDVNTWLIRSKQTSRRHPLDPDGKCMICGDVKIGYWGWEPWEM